MEAPMYSGYVDRLALALSLAVAGGCTGLSESETDPVETQPDSVDPQPEPEPEATMDPEVPDRPMLPIDSLIDEHYKLHVRMAGVDDRTLAGRRVEGDTWRWRDGVRFVGRLSAGRCTLYAPRVGEAEFDAFDHRMGVHKFTWIFGPSLRRQFAMDFDGVVAFSAQYEGLRRVEGHHVVGLDGGPCLADDGLIGIDREVRADRVRLRLEVADGTDPQEIVKPLDDPQPGDDKPLWIARYSDGLVELDGHGIGVLARVSTFGGERLQGAVEVPVERVIVHPFGGPGSALTLTMDPEGVISAVAEGPDAVAGVEQLEVLTAFYGDRAAPTGVPVVLESTGPRIFWTPAGLVSTQASHDGLTVSLDARAVESRPIEPD